MTTVRSSLVRRFDDRARRHQPSSQGPEVLEGDCARERPVLVVVMRPERHAVALADPLLDAAPDHRRLGLGGHREFPDLLAVAVALEGDDDVVVLDDAALLDQVVVGEVRAHPRTEHHRGRDLDGAVGARQVVPDLVLDLEGRGAGLAGRTLDADQRVLRAERPDAHLEGARPVLGVDLHAHPASAGFAPHEAVDPVDDLEDAGVGLGGGGRGDEGRDEDEEGDKGENRRQLCRQCQRLE